MALILLTEDNPDVLALVSHQLRMRDHDVIAVELPDIALRLVDNGLRPDLAVLDVMMPVMSGFKLIKAIRERTGLDRLPAVFISARSQPEDVAAGRALATDYLLKPFRASQLVEAVNRALMKAAEQTEALNSEAPGTENAGEPASGGGGI